MLERLPEALHECWTCHQLKPESQFSILKQRNGKLALNRHCYECFNAKRRAIAAMQRQPRKKEPYFWNAERLEILRIEYLAGATLAEVGEKIGCSRSAVSCARGRHLADLRRPSHRRSPHVEEIRKLAIKGRTNVEIAAVVGITPNAVAGIIYRYGIERGRFVSRGKYTHLLQRIANLSAAGLSADKIAAQMGVPAGSIRRIMYEHGLFARQKAVQS